MLITGSIWAKATWGHWWVWDEPTLVSFLIVFLLYATYQPLRFSIEDPERQARYACVFAVTAGAFVPLNFIAVRLAQAYTHPRVLATRRRRPAGEMQLPFYLVARSAWRCCTSRSGATRWPRRTRPGSCARCAASSRGDDAVAPVGRTAAPHPPDARDASPQTTNALPDNAGYVAAAYLVFLALVLIYVVIMACEAGAHRARAGRAQRARRRAGRAPRRRDPRRGAEPEEAARR